MICFFFWSSNIKSLNWVLHCFFWLIDWDCWKLCFHWVEDCWLDQIDCDDIDIIKTLFDWECVESMISEACWVNQLFINMRRLKVWNNIRNVEFQCIQIFWRRTWCLSLSLWSCNVKKEAQFWDEAFIRIAVWQI